MSLISIIIPSLRPEELNDCIKSVQKNSVNINYELIIVSPFSVKGDNLIWVEEKFAGGTIRSINFGYWKSSGKWITVLSDEARPQKDWLKNMLAWIGDREDTIIRDCILPAFTVTPDEPFHYYGKTFAPFPFAHQNLLKKVGGLFDPIYKSFYSDPDLSLRIYREGGNVFHIPDAIIYHPPKTPDNIHKINKNKYFLADREAFRKRWDHLGEFSEPALNLNLVKKTIIAFKDIAKNFKNKEK